MCLYKQFVTTQNQLQFYSSFLEKKSQTPQSEWFSDLVLSWFSRCNFPKLKKFSVGRWPLQYIRLSMRRQLRLVPHHFAAAGELCPRAQVIERNESGLCCGNLFVLLPTAESHWETDWRSAGRCLQEVFSFSVGPNMNSHGAVGRKIGEHWTKATDGWKMETRLWAPRGCSVSLRTRSEISHCAVNSLLSSETPQSNLESMHNTSGSGLKSWKKWGQLVSKYVTISTILIPVN